MVVRIHHHVPNPPRVYLREWREHMELTQEKLAERVGTDKGTISRLERGVNRMTDEWLFRLGEGLRIDPQRLYRHPEEPSLDAMVKDAPPDLQRQIFRIVSAMLKTGTDD